MKEKFYKHIGEVLLSAGYTEVEDKKWCQEIEKQQGGMQVEINGAKQTIPGKKITIKVTFEVIGEGSMDDREFAQLYVKQEQYDGTEWQVTREYPDDCLYFDEPEMFDKVYGFSTINPNI